MGNYFKILISSLSTIVLVTLQQYDKLIVFVVAFIIADVVTGLINSLKKGEKLNTKKGWGGFWKKMSRIMEMFIGFVIDEYIYYLTSFVDVGNNYPRFWIGTLIGCYIAINEIISILSNLKSIDEKAVPKFLVDIIEELERKIENED